MTPPRRYASAEVQPGDAREWVLAEDYDRILAERDRIASVKALMQSKWARLVADLMCGVGLVRSFEGAIGHAEALVADTVRTLEATAAEREPQ